ncbi:MAG TPA: type II toxin-antitoxin system VapC family toxin [Solirubrobacterales bacterium]|nr:type II toxin-antitoxin system VapC family toxin [Solirubrobacterales bacterium]
MRLLLDTHALVWAITEPERVAPKALELIESSENEVFASVVSPWELAIKLSRRRIELPPIFYEALRDGEFSLLPVAIRHTEVIAELPHHHRDPFDRMLIAQAQVEGLTLVTSDREIRRYPVSILPASG